MNLQLIEVYIPDHHYPSIDEKLQEFNHQSYWVSSESKERMLVRILVKTKDVEEILNYLEEVSNVVEGFETLLFTVQTYLSKDTIHEESKEQKEEE